MTQKTPVAWLTGAGLLALLVFPLVARAQADLSSASAAFRRAQAMQLQGDHDGAADAFLLADSIAPSAEAIRGAITNLRAGGHSARAASAAVEAQRRHPDDARTHTLADRVLRELSSRLVRVTVRCAEPCTVSLSSRAVTSDARTVVEFYVEPGTHEVQARFAQGSASSQQLVVDRAGDTAERHFAPPAPPPAQAASEQAAPPAAPIVPRPAPVEAAAAHAADTRDDTGLRKLHPLYFWLGAGAAAALTGATVWSALDTVDANDAYEQAPSKAKYDQAKSRQDRTNILIGASSVTAVGAALLGALFTRWRSPRSSSTKVSVDAAHVWVDAGAGLTLTGHVRAW